MNSNVITIIVFYNHKNKIQVTQQPQPQLTKDASKLLADLLSGGAVVVTNIIDPKSVFLWSPKDSGND